VGVRLGFAAGILSLPLFALASAQTDPRGGTKVPAYVTEYLSHEQARPVFDALGERLPPASAWREWIAISDRDTRARVAQGDETSVVNLLLFGTSFTNEPRITSTQLDQKQIGNAVSARLADFERALGAVGRDLSRARPEPGENERLLFARRVLGDRSSVRARLLSMLERTIGENETHERLVRDAQALGDPSLQFAERSRIYRERGLSSDTSLRINFAVEEALKGLHDPVRRVAIIGPGLDVTDKQEGHDFYPQQSIQPFAVIDSLIRLGLAAADEVTVTTLDVNARVNDHLERSVDRARMRSPYIIHLPVAVAVPWRTEFLRYWQTFGDRIGSEAASPPVPRGVGLVKVRSIGVRPSIVERIRPCDVNITAQHLALAATERFDLIIATNVFVYYDRLQQGLAMISVANMLRPGGFLLSNNALVEVPSTELSSVGYTKTLYSDRDEDGDLIIWYQKAVR
jgi:hypothetical protein